MSLRDFEANHKRWSKYDVVKTGWPPGLLQDDDRRLSGWLASRPPARLLARQAAQEIINKKEICKNLEHHSD